MKAPNKNKHALNRNITDTNKMRKHEQIIPASCFRSKTVHKWPYKEIHLILHIYKHFYAAIGTFYIHLYLYAGPLRDQTAADFRAGHSLPGSAPTRPVLRHSRVSRTEWLSRPPAHCRS